MKKISIILILLLFTFFTGCSLYEIEDYLIVAGIGIDYDIDDNIYEITCEFYKENNGEITELTSIIKIGTGKKISEAFNDISVNMNKHPYLNHCSILLLSEDVIRYKYKETINYLLHDARIRSSCYMMVSYSQTPTELFKKSEEKGKVIAYEIYNHFDRKEQIIGLWLESRFNKILNQTIDEKTTVILPSIEYDDDCIIKGVYLIKNDNQIIHCEKKEVFVFQLFHNKITEGLLNNEEYFTYLKKVKTKIEINENRILLTVDLSLLTYDEMLKNKEQYKENIKRNLDNNIKSIYHKYQTLGYDPFGIYNHLYKYKPFLYNKLMNDEIKINNIKFETNINIDLLTLGLSEERIE